jgi:hypothetical protein
VIKILTFFTFLLLFGCGDQFDARETKVYFSFEKNFQTLLTTPGRFVLFAHDQSKLQRAKVILPGSNTLTLPNGNWKFSIFGFIGSVANTPLWDSGKDPYCGRTDFINLDGNPKVVSITVSLNNCTPNNLYNRVRIIISSYPPPQYYVRWSIPQGSRDQVEDENVGDSFITDCSTGMPPNVNHPVVHMPQAINQPQILFPYYLILKIYTGSNCEPDTYLGSIEFDGDLSLEPIISLRNIPRAQGSISIAAFKLPTGTEPTRNLTVTIPVNPPPN